MVKQAFLIGGLVIVAVLLARFWPTPPPPEKPLPASPLQAEQKAVEPQRILFVNSYHRGYPWSDGIQKALIDALELQPGRQPETWHGTRFVLRVQYLDTKRNPAEQTVQKAAGAVLATIRDWRPDIVATSDDNAVKYVTRSALQEFPSLPFVFCGVNWSAAEYDLPSDRVTGMIEVQPVDQIIETLSPFARGKRIAFLKGYDLSAVIEADAIEAFLGIPLQRRLVRDFNEWQSAYRQLQQESDILLIGNYVSVPDWNDMRARQLISEETRIPSGAWDAWMQEYALLTFSTVPDEQGEWVAETVLSILSGKPPVTISQVRNQKATIYRNMLLAKQLGIVFPMELLRRSWAVDQGRGDDS
ncbi:MAG: ABC transporter substrate binding protein [Desulfuromonadales bacterium]|nr:ABC transporter substrate binding protein [Desulfuromonadales bacterium]